MKFTDYYKDTHIFAGLGVSLFLNIVIWSLLAWRIFPLQDQVVIHYNVYFGIDQFGPAWQAGYVPALGLAVTIVNFLAGLMFWVKNPNISRIVNYLSICLQVFLVISVIFIILANI